MEQETQEAKPELWRAIPQRVGVKPEDIDLLRVAQAYGGISFSPEKRAEQNRAGYLEYMGKLWAALAAKCKTDEHWELIADEMTRYREGYLRHFWARMGAKGRCLSAMITGPSKFPTRSNDKRNATEHRRLEEFVQFCNRAEAAMHRKLHDTIRGETIEQAGGEIEVAKRKLANMERLQATMKAANAIVRKKGMDRAEKVAKLAEITGMDSAKAAGLLEPDFCGRLGFADFELTNNNARIKAQRARVAELEKREALRQPGAPEELRIEAGEAVIEENRRADRVQITFPGKPDEETRAKLKRAGFRWSPTNGAWQRQLTQNAIEAAKYILCAPAVQS